MSAILAKITDMVEYATRPPAPPVDRTLPPPIQPDNLEELIKQAKEEYKMDKPRDFNVAVVGAQGAGKSALINGMRSMTDTQEGAATVGEISRELKAYRGAFVDLLVFWEFPGAGVGHPALTYFTDKKLYAFDLILIVSDRFHHVDFEVARSALRFSRRFLFVRTKADLAVKRIVEREKVHVGQAIKKLRDDVQASFREGLRLAGLADRWSNLTLFVVSSREYMNPRVYAAEQEEEEEEEEEEDGGSAGHHKMDEDTLLNHVTSLIRNRVRRSRSSRKLA